MFSISLESVSKSYGRRRVLGPIDLELVPGSVTGLVGPNGSGKSTLMRLMSGLGRPSSGTVLVNGRAPDRLVASENAIGAFLGVQNLHHGRTVIETLRIAAYLAGLQASRADDRLRWSGLEAVGRRLVKGLSLGMKVRLGMALATLREPGVLLLDEPMNGLDVDGIQWIKSVVFQHVEGGGTALVSSHLLNELQVIADRVVILSRGEIVRDVTIADLTQPRDEVCVRVADPHRFRAVLEETPWSSRERDGLWTIRAGIEEVAWLAFRATIPVLELRIARGQTLEDLFVASADGEFIPAKERGEP